jgi:hypothetical protein
MMKPEAAARHRATEHQRHDHGPDDPRDIEQEQHQPLQADPGKNLAARG